MQILQQLYTIPLYISYFFKVIDLHSLQAPFVYKFYSQLIDGIKTQKTVPEIEKIRESLQKSQDKISGADLGAGSRYSSVSGRRKVASIARYGVSSAKDCLLLSQLVKMSAPDTCIELGTSLGLTTAYLSRAMPKGTIYTFEGNTDLCKIATENWEQLGCNNISIQSGNIDDKLPKLLKEINDVDFVIIDANHTAPGVLRYIDCIKPHLTPGGIMYVDDIRWSIEMYKAWQETIKAEQVTLSIEFLNSGILIFKEGLPKQHYILSC